MKSLNPIEQKFILHWGTMGAQWGINRTVAQIHALLMLSEPPLNAEEISEVLGVARSNVSTSLKELQGWGVVSRVHVMGDSRDHFESKMDVWEMFRVVLDERKRREVDPTEQLLSECLSSAEADPTMSKYSVERIRELTQFFQLTTSWYNHVRKWPTTAFIKFFTAGDKLLKLLGMG